MNYLDNEEGIGAARRFAAWHIGDPSWAGAILEAYFNPERTNRYLDEDMSDGDVD